jgi:hypothetical protein
MRANKIFLGLVATAILIKLALFVFGTLRVVDSKYGADTPVYLELADGLYHKGSFSLPGQDGLPHPETFRTPGYPLFLSGLHDFARIPLNGVIFVQIMLTLLSAWSIYFIAIRIEPKIAALSVLIFLFDLPTTMISLRLLTETLFIFFMAFFMLTFVLYLKSSKVKFLVLSALLMAALAYVRPGSYYLSGLVVLFIVYANVSKDSTRALMHAVLFGAIVFSLLGAWQVRNYHCCKLTDFSTVACVNNGYGLNGSYTREKYPLARTTRSGGYYVKMIAGSLASFMTSPGSLKYFGSPVLTAMGKAWAYPFVFFWMVGFMAGVVTIGRNIYYQFLLLIIAYFLFGSVLVVTSIVSDRFRVPVVPCIAIISAYGWLRLRGMAYENYFLRQ